MEFRIKDVGHAEFDLFRSLRRKIKKEIAVFPKGTRLAACMSTTMYDRLTESRVSLGIPIYVFSEIPVDTFYIVPETTARRWAARQPEESTTGCTGVPFSQGSQNGAFADIVAREEG